MSRVIVIRWEPGTLRAAVVRAQSGRAEVLGVVSVPWDGADSSADAVAGRKLAEGLAPILPSRAPVIVAVGREGLDWQHLSLPPCPDEDLPDLVRMQADYNHSASDDSAGLDYLPLAGDAETPHRVWAISVGAAQLAKLHRVIRKAELKIDRLVPLALGWHAWAKHSVAAGKQPATISVAPHREESTIWATVGERVVMFRQVHLPHDDALARTTALTSELRRTLLAFVQEQPDAGTPSLQLVGDDGDDLARLADELSAKLEYEVEVVSAEMQQSAGEQVSLPMLGLALDEAAGQAPLVDLLHPRRRPAPRTGRRTYALAAAAAISLVALIGWQGHAKLQAPLDAAVVAQAEIDLLEESSDSNRDREQRAASIRGWLTNSVNLLSELQILSTHVRPEPLDAEDFPVDDDIVLAKVVLQNKQFVIDALAKENADVQPVEYRLRDVVHRVRRGKTERSEALPGYPLSFQSIVDVDPGEETER